MDRVWFNMILYLCFVSAGISEQHLVLMLFHHQQKTRLHCLGHFDRIIFTRFIYRNVRTFLWNNQATLYNNLCILLRCGHNICLLLAALKVYCMKTENFYLIFLSNKR